MWVVSPFYNNNNNLFKNQIFSLIYLSWDNLIMKLFKFNIQFLLFNVWREIEKVRKKKKKSLNIFLRKQCHGLI